MKQNAAVFATFLFLGAIGSRFVSSLECYSCDSDRTDQDCNDIKSLPKQVCQSASDSSSAVALKCGFQHVKLNSTERIFRGCMVAGECELLQQQATLTSKYRLETCRECSEDNCNDSRSGQAQQAVAGLSVLVGGLVVAFVNGLL